jgi:hypothetical protein
MSVNYYTGSEDRRFEEIHARWLVFEPSSNAEFDTSYFLYTTPVGQTFEPTVQILSGSVSTSSSVITIEKQIHIFYDETEAVNFISDTGEDNVVSYKRVTAEDSFGLIQDYFEVQVINHPSFDISFDLKDASNLKGFKAEVFRSGSIVEGTALELATKKEVYSKSGMLVSDTYHKFFKIESDV